MHNIWFVKKQDVVQALSRIGLTVVNFLKSLMIWCDAQAAFFLHGKEFGIAKNYLKSGSGDPASVFVYRGDPEIAIRFVN